MARHIAHYTLVRLLPQSDSGEFANMGVVVACPALGFFDFRLITRYRRITQFFEEFNRGQDNDYRKAGEAMNRAMYKNHPYGTQTTIGTGEHLKNPSMEKIHHYFKTYYVPNNMAIVLAGDIDYDKTIALVDKHFGAWRPGRAARGGHDLRILRGARGARAQESAGRAGCRGQPGHREGQPEPG